MNIFEQATIKKVRFETARGFCTVEDLWDVPLTSKNDFNLDKIARTVNTELKSLSEESFVQTKANPQQSLLELKLEVIKHIIAAKVEAEKAQKEATERRQKRARLLELLEKKQDQELEGLTTEQIKEQLAALD